MTQGTAVKTQFKGVVMLLLTAFVWGSSFVAQSVGMESIEAFTFNGIRTLMGSAALLPIILLKDKLFRGKMTAEKRAEKKAADKKVIILGSVLGLALCLASNLQQFAFYDPAATSGKIAFITALYMFFVPIIGLFIGKKAPWITWVCVVVGFLGLYFLSIDPSNPGNVGFGDVLSVLCAIAYAIHILLVEKFAPSVDGIRLSCMQFFVSGTISVILMFIFESPNIENILSAAVPLLYSGLMSCGVAYTLQIIGQKYAEATVASLLMCTESVFGVLCGAVVLHETLSGREILGCAIMLAAIFLSQLADKIAAATRGLGRKRG